MDDSTAKLRRKVNIEWLANYIARDPELGKHGDWLFAAAWDKTRDSYTEAEFTLAIVRLVHTLRELIAFDVMEAELATAPEPPAVYVPVRTRRKRRPRRSTATQLTLFTGKDHA